MFLQADISPTSSGLPDQIQPFFFLSRQASYYWHLIRCSAVFDSLDSLCRLSSVIFRATQSANANVTLQTEQERKPFQYKQTHHPARSHLPNHLVQNPPFCLLKIKCEN